MSACLQLREPSIARVRRWCLQRVPRACPGLGRGGVRRLPATADGRRVPAVPLALVRCQRVDAVPGRPGSATPGATRDWALYWRNRHLCFGALFPS